MKWLCLRLLLLFRYRIHFQGVELTRLSKVLYISNLTSQLDPLILGVLLKGQIILAAKLIVNGGIEFLTRLWGILFYPRAVLFEKPIMVRRLKKTVAPILAQDQPLILFPQIHLGRAEVGKNPVVEECRQGRQIVLVTIEGMRGSLFSADPAERRPADFFSLFMLVLKNGIFFMPKRVVTVKLTLMQEKAVDINRFLEAYYHAAEPLSYVPYFFWKKKGEPQTIDETPLIQEIRRLGQKDKITPDQHLYQDLGLDSLDVTQLIVFIEKNFQQTASFDHLQTVRDLLNTAAGKMVTVPYEKRMKAKLEKWQEKRLSPVFSKSRTIPEAFLERVEDDASLAACVDSFDIMTYERMKSLSASLALDFLALKDEKIGVLFPTTGESVCLILGLMLAQKVPVLLNWTLGRKQLEDVCRLTPLSAVITSYEFLDKLPFELGETLEEKLHFVEEIKEDLTFKKRFRAVRLGRRSKRRLKKQFGLTKISPEQPALIFFTSGSEKEPKGVPLSHENLLLNEKEGFERLELQSSDVFFGLVPPFHVYGFSLTILAPLMNGTRVVFAPNPLDLPSALEMIEKWKVTVLATTPSLLKPLLELASREKIASLRMIIVGAEKTPASLRARVEALGIFLVEGYGTTECSPLLTLNFPGQERGVGFPLPSVQIKILDPEEKTPLPTASKGIIVARGRSIFNGYLGNKNDPFLDLDHQKWYLTGDIGNLQEDGSLVLEGRISRTVKIGGELISLAWIEGLLIEALITENSALQMAVIAQEKEEGRPEMIAFTNSSIDLEGANQILRQAGVSNLVRVGRVIKKESLPLLGAGKIDYRKLQHEL